MGAKFGQFCGTAAGLVAGFLIASQAGPGAGFAVPGGLIAAIVVGAVTGIATMPDPLPMPRLQSDDATCTSVCQPSRVNTLTGQGGQESQDEWNPVRDQENQQCRSRRSIQDAWKVSREAREWQSPDIAPQTSEPEREREVVRLFGGYGKQLEEPPKSIYDQMQDSDYNPFD